MPDESASLSAGSVSSAVTSLESLLGVNDRLSVYRELLERVKADPSVLADLRA